MARVDLSRCNSSILIKIPSEVRERLANIILDFLVQVIYQHACHNTEIINYLHTVQS